MRESKFKWVSISIALIIVFGVTYAIPGKQSGVEPVQQRDLKEEREKKERKLKKDFDNLPVADYEPMQPDNISTQSTRQQSVRHIRNARYDGFPIPIQEEVGGVEKVLHTHSMGDFPPIPTLKSDVVIIGEVTGTQAFLSNDKSFVYSEYTVRIKEILKGANQPPVSSTELITVERLGGAVRFPSGRIQKYRESDYGTPLTGHEYIFFLKYDDVGQTFSLLTAYELIDGRALALDNSGRFSEYKDVPDEVILNAVREAVKGCFLG
jgi:hypothetical protein